MDSNNLPDYNPEDYKNDQELDLNPTNYVNYGNYYKSFPPFDKISRMNKSRQMKFSDAITRRYALNPKFIELQAPRTNPKDIDMSRLNATSLGNMAFMSHHHPGSVFDQFYKEVMRRCRTY